MSFGLNAFVAVICATLVGLWLLWLVRRPNWMGFGGKTLWDWMSVLSMPAFLGLGSLIVGLIQIQLGSLRAEEEAFQTYLDRISSMDMKDPDQHALARAQTAAVLTQVTGARAARVLGFLDELGAMVIVTPDLESHDLRGAELKGLDLSGVNFEEADLRGVDFEGAVLVGANFEGALLRGADLKAAQLQDADFSEADLRGADFSYARLDGADFQTARHIGKDALARACIHAATLPDALASLPLPTGGCEDRAEEDDDD